MNRQVPEELLQLARWDDDGGFIPPDDEASDLVVLAEPLNDVSTASIILEVAG